MANRHSTYGCSLCICWRRWLLAYRASPLHRRTSSGNFRTPFPSRRAKMDLRSQSALYREVRRMPGSLFSRPANRSDQLNAAEQSG